MRLKKARALRGGARFCVCLESDGRGSAIIMSCQWHENTAWSSYCHFRSFPCRSYLSISSPIPARTASHTHTHKQILQSVEHQTLYRACVNTLGPPRAQHAPLICIFTKRPAATRGHQTNPSQKPHQHVPAALTKGHTPDRQTEVNRQKSLPVMLTSLHLPIVLLALLSPCSLSLYSLIIRYRVRAAHDNPEAWTNQSAAS